MNNKMVFLKRSKKENRKWSLRPLHIFIITGLFIFLNTCSVIAQGTNNPYPIDSTDIKVVFDQLGVNIFKFPVTIKDTAKHRINYIIEISDSGTVIYHKDFIETLLMETPKGFTPEDLGINDFYPKLDTGTHLVRIYLKHTFINEVSVIFVSKYATQKTDFEIDANTYGTANSRAFNYKGLILKKPTPLVVFYMNKKEKPVLSCPGRLSATEVQKRYDKTIIIYGELY